MSEPIQHATTSDDMPDDMPDEKSAGVEINPADIRLAAMNLLARREHSVLELRNKLSRRFSDKLVIDEQLSRLTDEHLQSDARFAESYARQRTSRGYGPVRLREELRERGVSEADVDEAMEELTIDWCALASEVWHKKFGALAPQDIKEQARRVRFMQYRGFKADHYQRLLRD
jgi:regulatory protein